MSIREYKPGTAFPGILGRTIAESTPAWPAPERAKPGAANVLFIVLDDTGFGHLGCYGSPVNTPNFNRLAQNGLLYSNMHTTALCSPTRSCILTGRNHHSNAMSCITEGATGYPGSNGIIPFENGFLSETLLMNGYNTYAIGKWHLTPSEQTSAAGPYDRWPVARGFQRYYGFLGGDTHQYYPDLIYDNHQVDPPKTPEQGYHLTEDLVDRAIQFIGDSKQVAPDKPFFLYFAPGAMHAPHHVPKEWIDKYKGMFDDGWDSYRNKVFKRQKELGIVPADMELSRHDPDVAEWQTLSPDEKKLYARMMEVFAGFLEHTDHHIGRLFSFIEKLGELENTLIMVISDNGASAEGGPHGSTNEVKFFNNVPESLSENLQALDELGGPKHFNHYSWGWAFAGNTPFRRWKRETYRGGVSDPFLVHWPKGIRVKGQVRRQFTHAIDMAPTVLDCLEITSPEQIRGVVQSPLEGVSFKHTFEDGNAPTGHETQYFEMFGHRSIYHSGWRAVCPYPGQSYKEASAALGTPITEDTLREWDAKHWELYNVEKDPAETRNLAQDERGRLIEMIAMWYVEAGKYKVLPIDSRLTLRLQDERPQATRNRKRYVYFGRTSAVPEQVSAAVLNRPHSITAHIEIPKGGAEGVILAMGSGAGGYALYVKDKKLHYTYNYVGSQVYTISSLSDAPEGAVEARFEFEPTAKPDVRNGKGSPGNVRLYFNRNQVGEGQLPVTVPLFFGLSGGQTIGRAVGFPISTQFQNPFEFTGTIHDVVVDVSGELIEDKESAMRAVMAHQ